MARIVCQVLHRAERISFLWSEGAASFEPYHLEVAERANLLQIAQQIHAGLAHAADAKLGHQLYRAVFRQDVADAGSAESVRTWLAGLSASGSIERLEFLSDVPGLIPWNLVAEEVNAERFWGSRFNLGAGRRVNALRSNPAVVAPMQLCAADADLVLQLGAEQQTLLDPLRHANSLVQTTNTLADELKNRPVDVLSLLVRFEGGQLRLGADAFTIRDLQDWFAENNDANPDPIVILMGCGNPSEQKAWQALLADASIAFSGLVANDSLLSAIQALDVGQQLAQQFIDGKSGLGEILRSLRQSRGPAAQAFSVFGSPQVHAVADAATERPELDAPMESIALPRLPYRPIAAFDAADRALFIGREDDAIRGALAIDHADTIGVLLHGSPAVGKTSYLQAGLLPYLEQASVGYRVLRDRSALEVAVAERDYPILILRCTSDLAGQFADALSVFCAQPLIYTTPAGTQVTVDLPTIMQQTLTGNANAGSTAIQSAPVADGFTASPGEADGDAPAEGPTARDLWIGLRDNKEMLGKALDAITRSLPFELVIAIDQGEELLTLVRTVQQQARRAKAIEMLTHVAAAAPRCKIVYTIRSQSLGQFVSLMPHGQTPAGWRPFYLRPLSEGEMVDALLWPTNREEIPTCDQIAHQKYGFTFEDGMAQQVVAEAIEAGEADQQSPLPIIQATGALLYDIVVQGKRLDVVRADDLKEFGGVKEALSRYLDRSIAQLPITKQSRQALRELIGKLYLNHADGTLSRDLILAEDLPNYWRGSGEPVEPIVNQASEELGLFEIQQLFIGGKPGLFVSLPQDSLAQLGKKIDAERVKHAYGRTRVIDMLWIMIPLTFLAAAVSFWATNQVAAVKLAQWETNFEDLKKEATEVIGKMKKDQSDFSQNMQEATRRPLYLGQIAQADLALRADNALRARQILLSQPAMRSLNENREDKTRLSDIRGFEWKYLWRYLNSERHLLEGHRGVVNGVAVSPDGTRSASASDDGTVRIWNLATGEVVALLSGPKTPLHAVAFAPDGKSLASAGADKLVRLWDISQLRTDFVEITKEAKTLKGHADAVNALAFGKDANTLASTGADKSVIVWDIAAGKEKHTLKDHGAAVLALVFASDGKTLVSAGVEAQVIVWDADAGKKTSAIKTAYQSIASLALTSDGKTLCTGGVETRLDASLGMIRFWSVADGKEASAAIQHSNAVHSVAFAPNDKSIATGGSDHVIRLWDVATAKQQHRWLGHLGAVRSLAFTRAGDALVSGSYDSTVKVWNPAQSSGPDVIQAHTDWVQALVLNPKNTLLASGSRDGTVKLWHPADGKAIKELAKHSGAVTSLAFSNHKDKSFLAVGTRDEKNAGEIKIWQIDHDAKQGYGVKELQTLKGHMKGVTSLAFHPFPEQAGLLISGSADNTVKLWDAAAGKEKETHAGHKDEVRCVAFSFDGKAFFSGGKDALVCYHEIGSKVLRTLNDLHLGSIESIALFKIPMSRGDEHEDATGIVTGSADQSLRVSGYNQADPKAVALTQKFNLFRGHTQPITVVIHVEIPNNSLVVSSSQDGTIRIFDLYAERIALTGHQGPVRAIAFASNQSFLASAGNDGTIRFWRTHPERQTTSGEKKD